MDENEKLLAGVLPNEISENAEPFDVDEPSEPGVEPPREPGDDSGNGAGGRNGAGDGGGGSNGGGGGNVTDLQAWKRSLHWTTNKAGDRLLAATITNATLILMHDAAFKGCLSRDLFSGAIFLKRDLPNVVGMEAPKAGQKLADEHVAYVIAAFSTITKFQVGIEVARTAIEAAGAQRPFHALQDHLDALVWDGQLRLETWLSRYLGAAETSITREVGRWWLISAMARAYDPGCQADYMLVLEGPQRRGKSTALRILGGEFALRKLPPLRDYERAAHALAGRWLVEVAELESFRGAAATQVKEFVTLTHDHFRMPWARYPQERGRSNVFCGTTNEERYLTDATGGSRFWPVRIEQLDRDALVRDRDALLAEAREAYKGGALWYPKDAEGTELADAQEERFTADAWEPRIAAWLAGVDSHGVESGERDGVTTGEILGGAVGLDAGRWTREDQSRVGAIMGRLGRRGDGPKWTSRQVREHGVRVRRYFRADE